MRQYLNTRVRFIGLIVGAAVVISGVLAGIAIVINDNNKITFGVGQAPVNPCDPDVTVNIVVDRVNEDQYLTGFTYSFVDKPACVGYDIETRMLTASDQVKNLFATSSLASDPTVIRVFATSSTSNWQLGKGSFSGTDATVTQISDSSFQVTFVNPVLLASDLGKILTAEILHLPLGTFNGAAKSIDLNNAWIAVSASSDASNFYIADGGNTSGTGYVYKSTQGFTSYASSSLQRINALPNGSELVSWTWLSQSDSGKYVVASGQNRRAYFSQNFGSTWDSVTTTSYYVRDGSSYNDAVNVSADGSIVCLVSRARTNSIDNGTVNIWTNYNFYNKANSDFKLNDPDYGIRDCKISADNKYVFVLGAYNIYRYLISDLTAGPVNLSGGLVSGFPNLFRIGISETGKYVVYGYQLQVGSIKVPRWKYSSDFGNTFSDSGGVLYSEGRAIGQITVSRDGSMVAAAIYVPNSSALGGILTSSDFGKTFATSSLAINSVYSIAASNDGLRIIGGTRYDSPNVIYFLSGD